MHHAKRLLWVLVISLAATITAAGQRMGMGQAPHIPGMFAPVVGSGAEYQITTEKGEPLDWTYAVVGEEDVDGQKGYWLEIRTNARGGEMIMKQLMVTGGATPGIKRMIMQPPGRGPMEMPVGMMNRMMRHGAESAEAKGSGAGHGMGEIVGTETITVPAGTFTCEHYRSTSNGETSDMWVSTKVAPYGLVKMTSAKTTMTLQKTLEHETSKITGEPQKMPMIPGMPPQ